VSEDLTQGLPSVFASFDHLLPADVVDYDLVDCQHLRREVRHPRHQLAPLLQPQHQLILSLLHALLHTFLLSHHLFAVLFGIRTRTRRSALLYSYSMLHIRQFFDHLLTNLSTFESFFSQNPNDLENIFKQRSSIVEIVELMIVPFSKIFIAVLVGHSFVIFHQ
jgi:hypothetical protein